MYYYNVPKVGHVWEATHALPKSQLIQGTFTQVLDVFYKTTEAGGNRYSVG